MHGFSTVRSVEIIVIFHDCPVNTLHQFLCDWPSLTNTLAVLQAVERKRQAIANCSINALISRINLRV